MASAWTQRSNEFNKGFDRIQDIKRELTRREAERPTVRTLAAQLAYDELDTPLESEWGALIERCMELNDADAVELGI
jgi:hypothetical protein